MITPGKQKNLESLVQIRKAQRNESQNSLLSASETHRRQVAKTDEISARIDQLAKMMRSSTKRGTIHIESLRQLDELSELLRCEHLELQRQAAQAHEMLETCQDELKRSDLGVRVLERLKELRSADSKRKAMRRTG